MQSKDSLNLLKFDYRKEPAQIKYDLMQLGGKNRQNAVKADDTTKN